MRVRAALALAACAAVSGGSGAAPRAASGGPARSFVVALTVPAAGDVSYGVAQVRIVPRAERLHPAPTTAARLVFAGRIGGLSIVARSANWSELRASTRVYLAVSKVTAGAGYLRDVAFFIVRRGGAGGLLNRGPGMVVFSIANARAAIG